jgi:ankyrin repeat protein
MESCLIKELHQACSNGELNYIKNILLKDTSLIYTYYPLTSRNTLIHSAVNSGKLEVVKFIAELDINNIDEYDDMGVTPLHNACLNNSKEIVQYLLESGAKSHNCFYDLYDCAIDNCYYDIVEIIPHLENKK